MKYKNLLSPEFEIFCKRRQFKIYNPLHAKRRQRSVSANKKADWRPQV